MTCHKLNKGQRLNRSIQFSAGSFSFQHLLQQFADVSIRKDDVVGRFKRDYLIESLKDKYPIGQYALPEKERVAAGLKKLLDANVHCKRVNDDGYFTGVVDPGTLSSIIQVAARKARLILGDFSFNVYKYSAFSNGATTCRSYKQRDPFFKYSSTGKPIEASGRSLSRLRALINCTPLWCATGGADNIMINNMDNVSFVPKNGTEQRAIVPQQAGNVCLQKGIAIAIRDRLKRVGVDLRDQTNNQLLAKRASISRSEATLDMKNASALMNYRIVWDIIPPDWFHELDCLRNTHGNLGNGCAPIEWNMFSSMGNGYNFELESLLFFVLASAACEFLGDYVGSISVYGDDIIVPTSCAPFVIEVLEAVGFLVNTKKTHITGNFRESCGAHYLNGIDVKPFYIKTEVKTLADIIRLCNRIREWSSVPEIRACDPRYFHIWDYYAKLIPRELRGGQNAAVDYALVTHEKPRLRLGLDVKLKPLNGYRALLRYWQNSARKQLQESGYIYSLARFEVADSGSNLPEHLSTADESVYIIKVNTDHAEAQCLYPQEYDLKDTYTQRFRTSPFTPRPIPPIFLRMYKYDYVE